MEQLSIYSEIRPHLKVIEGEVETEIDENESLLNELSSAIEFILTQRYSLPKNSLYDLDVFYDDMFKSYKFTVNLK